MYDRIFKEEFEKLEVKGLDLEVMARNYEEMGWLNSQISGEDKHLESEGSYIGDNFIKD